MEKKYWLINVSGHNGYSTMVHCEAETEEQAINAASEGDIFDDPADAKIAFAEEATESDLETFRKWGYINEL